MLSKEQLQKRCWESFNTALRKINEGKAVDYFTVVAKEAINEYIDFTVQLSNRRAELLNETPTHTLNKK